MGSQSGPFLAQKGFASSRPATQPLTQGYTMSQSQATGKNWCILPNQCVPASSSTAQHCHTSILVALQSAAAAVRCLL
jgi:hypothetical protein